MKTPVTSSWFTPLPPKFARIGISRGQPRGQAGYRMYRALAPGEWWNSVSVDEYRSRYLDQLSRLDPRKVLADLAVMAGDLTPALLCFERPHDRQYCHRAFVSAWLKDRTGLEVFEFGLEDSGCGWDHPKLPRAPSANI